LPLSPQIEAKRFFLIDEKTTGQSEILAALIKHYNLGTLVGNTSAGNIDEVLGINLPDKYNASIVAMLNEIPKAKENFHKGIAPDIKVVTDYNLLYQGKDYILNEIQKLIK